MAALVSDALIDVPVPDDPVPDDPVPDDGLADGVADVARLGAGVSSQSAIATGRCAWGTVVAESVADSASTGQVTAAVAAQNEKMARSNLRSHL